MSGSDMSVSDALALAPTSADKTAIDSAIDTLVAALDTANGNSRLPSVVQLKSELIDWVENLAIDLTA